MTTASQVLLSFANFVLDARAAEAADYPAYCDDPSDSRYLGPTCCTADPREGCPTTTTMAPGQTTTTSTTSTTLPPGSNDHVAKGNLLLRSKDAQRFVLIHLINPDLGKERRFIINEQLPLGTEPPIKVVVCGRKEDNSPVKDPRVLTFDTRMKGVLNYEQAGTSALAELRGKTFEYMSDGANLPPAISGNIDVVVEFNGKRYCGTATRTEKQISTNAAGVATFHDAHLNKDRKVKPPANCNDMCASPSGAFIDGELQ